MTQDEAIRFNPTKVFATLAFDALAPLAKSGDGVTGRYVFEAPGMKATFEVTLSGSALRDLPGKNALETAIGECLEEVVGERIAGAAQ